MKTLVVAWADALQTEKEPPISGLAKIVLVL